MVSKPALPLTPDALATCTLNAVSTTGAAVVSTAMVSTVVSCVADSLIWPDSGDATEVSLRKSRRMKNPSNTANTATAIDSTELTLLARGSGAGR